MISDSELYCPETSNVSITRLAGLRTLRERLDQAIENTRDFTQAALRSAQDSNPILACHAFDALPADSRQALRTVYVLSAQNRIEFGDTAGAARDFEIGFALGEPNVDEVDEYIRASIDADHDVAAFEALLAAYGSDPQIRHLIDCYRLRQAIRRSQIGRCKEIAADLADSAAAALNRLADTYKDLDRSSGPELLRGLEATNSRLNLASSLAKSQELLRGCDRIAELWWELVHRKTNPARTLRILQKIAAGRPLVITTMQGRGWIFSHMLFQIEPFLRDLTRSGLKDPFVVVLNPDRYANDALRAMYNRKICLIDERHPFIQRALYGLHEHLRSIGSPIARPIEPLNIVPHIRNVWAHPRRIDEWVNGQTVLKFTDEEHNRGQKLLAEMGIPTGAPFACFGVRENSYYLGAWGQKSARVLPWMAAIRSEEPQPKPQLTAQFRNMQGILGVNMANYASAVSRCTRDGIYMLRVGTEVEQDLPVQDDRAIDYARRFRSEFGDLYLMAHCKFMLTGATGNFLVCHAFKRPIVMTDYYLPNSGFLSSNPIVPNIFVPRLYWFAKEERFLTFSEMYHCSRYYQHANNCSADGVEVVHNEPDDIADAVDEMRRRIDGTWTQTALDNELQQRALGLYQQYHEGYGTNGRLSAAFLRKHQALIV